MMLSVVFAALFVHGVTSTKLIGDPGNGEMIPIDVTMRDGVAILIAGPAYPPQDFYSPSISDFDFEKQLEARKVLSEGVCYIRRFTGTYEQMAAALESSDGIQVIEEWNIRGEEIPAAELEKTIGEQLTRFCSGGKVFWLAESKLVTSLGKRQWSGGIDAGYTQSGGFSGSGGVSYTSNNISGSLGGGYSTSGGWSASATFTFKFRK